jgi:hypothetical protein
MAKIKIEMEAEDHEYGSEDSETIGVNAKESSHYTDSVEFNINGRRIHFKKDDIKKIATLLCD